MLKVCIVALLLQVVRFPLMDSCLLSDVVKPHPMMAGPAGCALLMEAFEHHALRLVYIQVHTRVHPSSHVSVYVIC